MKAVIGEGYRRYDDEDLDYADIMRREVTLLFLSMRRRWSASGKLRICVCAAGPGK